MPTPSGRWKKSDDRKKKKPVMVSTATTYDSMCRVAIRKHHDEMKNDPEHLTTKFLIDITKCNCRRKNDRKER